MPTKPNKAGNQQNYVPAGNGDASGEYGDDATGSNIHFKSFKKPDEPGKEVTEPGKQENKPVEPKKEPKISKPEPTYGGKGKELLSEELKKKMPKGKNIGILLQSIANADDEYCGLLADYYKNNPDLEFKMGANLNSYYWYSRYYKGIQLGQGILRAAGSYSKGGVLFHETGHAIDNTFFDELGNKSHWSSSYKSKKYGKTLKESIFEEMSAYFNNEEKVKEFRKEIENELDQEFNKEWGKYEKEYESLLETKNKITTEVINEDDVSQTRKIAEKLGNEVIEFKNKNKFIPQYVYDSSGYHKTDEYVVFEEELKEKISKYTEANTKAGELFQQKFDAKFPPEKIHRLNELEDTKFNLKRQKESNKKIKYGDLSDMVQAVFELRDRRSITLVGMGHNNGYYYKDPNASGHEAFAEIMSAKATNPASLSVLKKICPKSLEVFDEIIGEIRNGKK